MEHTLTAWLFWLSVAGIAYVYAGYPLILALFARLRPRPRWENAAAPSVTLLIAAHNEERVVERKLMNSLELDYPRDRLQVIVAADGSNDRTADVVRAFADRGVELSHIPERRGKTAAINRAMPLATGEIVVFSDANNMFAPDSLRRLMAPFGDRSVGAATGAKVIVTGDGEVGEEVGQSEGMYWRYESFVKAQETRLGSCTGACGEILAVRRELFEPPPDGVINDDFYIAMRAIRRGFRLVYVPEARSFERASPTAQGEIARRARIVAGRFQSIFMARKLMPSRPLIIWQVISHKFARPLVPLAMLCALLANVAAVVHPVPTVGRTVLQLATPWNWILLCAQTLFYVTALLPRLGVGMKGTGGRLLYLPSFLLDSNLAALIGLLRYVTGRQSSRWERVPRV